MLDELEHQIIYVYHFTFRLAIKLLGNDLLGFSERGTEW